jgi:hypothetical protein
VFVYQGFAWVTSQKSKTRDRLRQCLTVQGLITGSPAASKGLASRVATMKAWRFAVAAM